MVHGRAPDSDDPTEAHDPEDPGAPEDPPEDLHDLETLPAGEDPADRREHPRGAIELKVEYKRLNTFFADYTRNISKGGTFIKTTKPLDVGTIFVFRLAIPSFEETLDLRGEVRWVVREGEPPPEGVDPDHEPGMGIRFIFDDDEERRAIERVVEKMMVDSLGQLLYSKLLGKERTRGNG